MEIRPAAPGGQGLAASLLEGRSSWTAGRAIFVYALYRGEPKYGTVDSVDLWMFLHVFALPCVSHRANSGG